MQQPQESEFDFDTTPTLITDPELLKKCGEVIESWGYKGVTSGIIVWGGMLGFTVRGADGQIQSVNCPAEFQDNHLAHINVLRTIPNDVAAIIY